MFSPNMEHPTILCPTEENTLSHVSGDHYANYSVSRRISQWHITPKLMVKRNGSTKSSRSTSAFTSTISRTTGCTSYHWQSSPTIIPSIQPQESPPSSPIRGFTRNLKCPLNQYRRKVLTRWPQT